MIKDKVYFKVRFFFWHSHKVKTKIIQKNHIENFFMYKIHFKKKKFFIIDLALPFLQHLSEMLSHLELVA